MSSMALGIGVDFLKQPDALPGRAPPQIFFYFFLLMIKMIFFCLRSYTRQCGLFQKSDPNPQCNAGHHILENYWENSMACVQVDFFKAFITRVTISAL
jgi:hypothetical protein